MIRPKQVWLGVFALALLLVLASPVFAANSVTGVITAVENDNYVVFLTDIEGTQWEFSLSLLGHVVINDEERDISDLQPGDDATVTFRLDEERMVATMIRVTRE